MVSQRSHSGVEPDEATWRTVRDLSEEYWSWSLDSARMAARRWTKVRRQLEEPTSDRTPIEIWLREQRRAFAIETGQIEGLYLLRGGVTEAPVTEGFESARSEHSVTAVAGRSLKGLLQDQEAAIAMMFTHVKDERPLRV